jgi:hypothetical protein
MSQAQQEVCDGRLEGSGVFQHAQVRHQGEGLEYHADLLASHLTQLAVGDGGDVLAIDQHLAVTELQQQLVELPGVERARAQLSELAAFHPEPELLRALPADAPLPTDYAKHFSYSNLARIRRGTRSGTVLATNTTLFSFRKGSAALEAVRFASAFFGKGQFSADTLEVRDGRYVLRQKLEGPYFQPLSAEQITHGEHTKMAPNGTLADGSRAVRTRSNIQTQEAVVEITETGGRFTLAISVGGTDHVPVAIELAFRTGGKLEGVEPLADLKDAYLLKTGTGRYTLGNDVIEFGPGCSEHTYTQVRGALPKWDGPSVYLTGITPFKTTLTIG